MSSPALKLANTHFNTPKEGTIEATLLLLVEENKRLRDERESMMNSKVTMDEHAWAIVKNYRETMVKMDEELKTLKKQAQEHKEADEQILKLNKELLALKDAEIEKLKVNLSNTMMDKGRLAETIWEKDAEIEKLKKKIIMDEKDYEMLDYYRTEAHEIAIFTDDEVRADDITTIIPYIKKLKNTINKMAGSRFTTEFCFENWIVEDQIDPRLLMANYEDSFKQDENGKWIKNEEECE